jgi:hypothetical protein
MQKSINNKTALITGASSGIGASLATFLAEHNVNVVLVARREPRLVKLTDQIRAKGGQATYYACDISHAQARQKLVRAIRADIGQVDILVNNAGFGWYGYFHQMAWRDAQQMLAVNVEAAVHLTSLLLPDMLERKQGHIINISSIAGGMPNQGIAVYAASKAFLDAFTTSLHRELRGSGVSVSAMRLGPVRTEFFDQAKKRENGRAVPAANLAIPVERVSRALWRLLKHPRRAVYVPGWLCLSGLVEPLFGWMIDLLGPLLLRRRDQ